MGVAGAAAALALVLSPEAQAIGQVEAGHVPGVAAAADSPGELGLDVQDAAGHGLRSVDVRDAAVRRPAQPVGPPEARVRLRRSLGSQGVYDVDQVTGTPRVVARLDGHLSGPSDAAPQRVALDYVREHAEALGLDADDLDGLRLTRDYTDINGTTHLAWAQRSGGVEVFEHGLIANVAADGRLLNVMGAPVPDLDEQLRSTAPKLGARRALGRALDNADARGRVPRARGTSDSSSLKTRFAGGDEAHLVLFPEAPGRTRLAWRVLATASSTEVYEYVIDATSGAVLLRDNKVKFASGRVWQYAPQIHQVCPECDAAAGEQRDLPFKASWSTLSNRLEGNNTHVYTDVDDDDAPDEPFPNCPECGEIPPSGGGNWHYDFEPNPDQALLHSDACDPVFPQCSWAVYTSLTPPVGFGWRSNLRQNATQVYWYVNNFHDWLKDAPFGFTRAAGNFEGSDKVHAQVLDGANTERSAGGTPGLPDRDHLNNANMSTPAAGSPPRMQMYLFFDANDPSGTHPQANGGDDASVIYHEYAHGLSGRLVLDANGTPSLRSFQAGAMGEGWSDWYAMDYLEGNGLEKPDSGDDGEMNMGVYVLGRGIHGLRSEGLDCGVGSTDPDCPGGVATEAGGYTLADVGKVADEPEVHADGEIWAQTLWELRQRLIADLGPNAGRTQARSLITRAMELAPPDPSFIEMRNAILQADVADGGVDSSARIWDVFAKRGMGYFATDRGSSDTSPEPSFDEPPVCGANATCGTIRGRVVERASKQPLRGARVEIDGPANLAARTNAKGRYRIRNVPVPPGGSYRFISAAKRGHRTVTKNGFRFSGGNAKLDFKIYRDWAAIGGGAKLQRFSEPDYSAFGCGPAAAFDLSLTTGWGSTSIRPEDRRNGPGGAKSATVKLPRAIDVSRIAIDPGAICGDDDSAATAKLRIRTKRKGARRWVTVGRFRYRAADNHRLNELRPRRGARKVKRVEVTMLANQGPRRQGQVSWRSFMDLSEVQVYGKVRAKRRR